MELLYMKNKSILDFNIVLYCGKARNVVFHKTRSLSSKKNHPTICY
jgi:hypothetical protein